MTKGGNRNIQPDVFAGQTLTEFDKHMQLVETYAKSMGQAATYLHKAPMPAPQIFVPELEPMRPNLPAAGATAEERADFDSELKMYTAICADNARGQAAYRAELQLYNTQQGFNNEANSCLEQCFSQRHLAPVRKYANACDRITHLRAAFASNLQAPMESRHWDREFTVLSCENPTDAVSVQIFIQDLVILCDEKLKENPEEAVIKDFLIRLCSKITTAKIKLPAMSKLCENVLTKMYIPWEPELIDDPAAVAGQAQPVAKVQRADHYRTTINNLLTELRSFAQLDATMDYEMQVDEKAGIASSSRSVRRANNATLRNDPDDPCRIHTKSQHTNAECRRQVKEQRANDKGKGRAHTSSLTSSSSSSSGHKSDVKKHVCDFCKKEGHIMAHCRKLKRLKDLSSEDLRNLRAMRASTSKRDDSDSDRESSKKSAPAKKVISHLKTCSSVIDADNIVDATNPTIVTALMARSDSVIHLKTKRLGLIDSGASVWMSPKRHIFSKLTYMNDNQVVEMANGNTIPISGYGDVHLVLQNGSIKHIRNALYVPDLEDTLISVYSIIGDSGDIVSFTKDSVLLTDSETEECTTIGRRIGDLYYLFASIEPTANSEASFASMGQNRRLSTTQPDDGPTPMDTSLSDVTSEQVMDDNDYLLFLAKRKQNTVELGVSSSTSLSHALSANNIVQVPTVVGTSVSNLPTVTVHELAKLHQQFGHIHLRTIMQTGHSLGVKLPKVNEDAIDLVNHSILQNCIICNQNKATQHPIHSSRSPAPRKLYCLGTDVIPIVRNGKIIGYWQIVVDEYSAFITIHFLDSKGDATDSMIRHIADVENRFYPLHVYKVRSDSGELLTNTFIHWCNAKIPCIHVNPSPASVKELNGLAERNVRSINEMKDSMLQQAGLPPTLQFTKFAILYAAVVKNTLYHSRTKNVPYVAYFDKMVDMAVIHTFGTLISIWISPEQRSNRKIRRKSELGLFLGYKGEDMKIVIALNFTSGRINEYYHVTFHEGVFVGENPTPQLLEKLSKQYPLPQGIHFDQSQMLIVDNEDINQKHMDMLDDEQPSNDSLHTSAFDEEFSPNVVDTVFDDPYYYRMEVAGQLQPIQPIVNIPDHDDGSAVNGGDDNDTDNGNQYDGLPVNNNLLEDDVDDIYIDIDGDLRWIGEDVDYDDLPHALRVTRKSNNRRTKRKRPGNANKFSFNRKIPTIDWSMKAESATPNVPIPHGNLRSIPNTIEEALSRPDEAPYWLAAMCEEHDQLIANQTWDKTILPQGKNLLSGKWVFDYKVDEEGNIIRFKARWVVRGFSQIEGEDYNQVYSPVTKTTTIRLLIGLAAIVCLYIRQYDIKGAFLHAILEEANYVEMPHGFAEFNEKMIPFVCKLIKSLYGLHQAAREWYKTLWGKYEDMGYTRNLSDVCHFWRQISYIASTHSEKPVKGREHTTVHVDDILHFSPDPEAHKRFKDEMNSSFTIGSESRAKWILKMQLIQTTDGYFLTNALYVKKLLEQLKIWDSDTKPARTPMSSQYKHDETTPALSNADATNFRSALMKISYIATKTRPDISFAVNLLAQYQIDPRDSEMKALARLHRYLLGTWDYGLHYTRTNIPSPNIRRDGVYEFASNEYLPQGYADADWANDPSRYSRTGFVVMFANAAVSWQSTRQQIIACSSSEAELVALNELSREMKWMRNLMTGIGIHANGPLRLWQDNMSAESIANNLFNDKRTKHMDVREKFINLQIEQKQQEIKHIASEDMVADIFTKPLTPNLFTKHRAALGLVSQSSLTVVE